MPATLLDIVDKTYSKKHALLHFVYLCIRCTGLKKTFFFLVFPWKTAKIHKNGDRRESVLAVGRGRNLIILWREDIRVQIYPRFGFMNIYRNITYILYLFLFVKVLKGLPCVLLRAWPCLKTPPTNYWQGLDVGSLTCTLIGWLWAHKGSSLE